MPGSHPPSRAQLLSRTIHELRRAAHRRRRTVTAVLAGLVALAAVHIWAPTPPATRVAVVAAHDLAAGTALTADDLRLVDLPPDAVPAGTASSPAALVGAVVAGPMRAGEAVTDQRVVGGGLLAGYPAGVEAMPVRLADGDAVALLQVGDEVDVLAATGHASGDAETVASAVPVVALPAPADSSSDGRLVVLAVTPEVSARLAEAVATTQVTVAIRH